MLKLEKSIEIDAPVKTVFAYVVDPAHHPEWDPGVDAVKAIQRLPDGRSTYTSVGKLLGLPLDWQEEQVEIIPNERIVLTTHGTGLEVTTTFRFEQLDGGKTHMRFVSEITVHGPGPLARFGETFLEKYLVHGGERAFATVKAHIEAEARAATPI